MKNSENTEKTPVRRYIVAAAAALFSIVVMLFAVYGTLRLEGHLKSYSADGGQEYDLSLVYYNRLTLPEQRLYSAIVGAAERLDEYSDTVDYYYDSDNLRNVLISITAEHPELFYLREDSVTVGGSGTSVRAQLSYIGTPAEIDMMMSELERAKAEYLSHIPEGADDYTAALALHDALIRGCSAPDEGDDNPLYNCSYGALVLGKATSKGYAQAYQTLLGEAGIYSFLEYGQTDGGSETVWNTLYIGGGYCCTDVLRDDPAFASEPSLVLHPYFCVTRETVAGAYEPFLPDLYSSDASPDYYQSQELRAGSPEELNTLLVREIGKACAAGADYFELAIGYETGQNEFYDTVISAIGSVRDETGADILDVCDIYPLVSDNGVYMIGLHYPTQNTPDKLSGP